VLIYGLGPLGAEVAKNIVLAGLLRLTLFDNEKTRVQDLGGQFFLTELDVGHSRAARSLEKIQQLNLYVTVDAISQQIPNISSLINRGDEFDLKCYQVVVMTQGNIEEAIFINQYCRENNIHFIMAQVHGLFSRFFNDFGNEFEVLDKDGEPPVEVMIKNISPLNASDNEAMVEFLEGTKHDFQIGDIVEFKEVEQEGDKKSLNGACFEVKNVWMNKVSININFNDYACYKRNGLCIQVKQKISVKFLPIRNFSGAQNIDISNNNMNAFDLGPDNDIIHYCFSALDEYLLRYKSLPGCWDLSDYKNRFLQIFNENYLKQIMEKHNLKDFPEEIPKIFCFSASAVWPPLAAFTGGVVAQEIIKAITHKFNPIHQLFYTNCRELASDLLNKQNLEIPKPQNDRYDNLRICVGDAFAKKIWGARIFMVGAGAIGCELMKNYAMLGVGRSGKNNI
jgi:molybdopterin/thiamine biosynthesis adenylyltransferase